jgi:F0F1-type ATP synthase assembly protein I
MSDPAGPNHESEAELERRLRKLLGEDEQEPVEEPRGTEQTTATTPKEEPTPESDEIEIRLKGIDERLDQARRQHRMPDVPDWNFKRPPKKGPTDDSSHYRAFGIAVKIGYTLVACMLTGWFVGWLIDHRSGGTLGQAIGALAGSLIGFVLVLWMIMRGDS